MALLSAAVAVMGAEVISSSVQLALVFYPLQPAYSGIKGVACAMIAAPCLDALPKPTELPDCCK